MLDYFLLKKDIYLSQLECIIPTYDRFIRYLDGVKHIELLVAEKKNKVDVWFGMWSDVWVGGFFSLLMVLWFANMNCHMEMHGCVFYRYAKPGGVGENMRKLWVSVRHMRLLTAH